VGHEATAEGRLIHVVAGVLRDAEGRVLLARRAPDKHLGGTWEFPGGKREPGESGTQALKRELAEELGISAGTIRPWLSLTHAYPELTVRLWLHLVEDWRGELHGREGQALDWVAPEAMRELPMPAADRPIVRALTLDPRYAITPDPAEVGGQGAVLDWARGALAGGVRLFQLHAPSLAAGDYDALGRDFGSLVRAHGGRWLATVEPDRAEAMAADGLHLDAQRLAGMRKRPLGEDRLLAVACRDAAGLAQAGAVDADFVTLAPVRVASGASGSGPLGWRGFAALCACSPRPVYALGGIAADDLGRSRSHGGFGVAGTRGFGPGR